jgi:hypothetical protein
MKKLRLIAIIVSGFAFAGCGGDSSEPTPIVKPPVTNPGTNPDNNNPDPDPTFSNFSPATAFIGETITLTGEHFGTEAGAFAVWFGAAEAEVIEVTDKQVKAIVPDEIENAAVRIRLIKHENSLSLEKDFTLRTPVIESISHTSGFSGQLVRIKGKGFRNSYKFAQITFGDQIVSAGSITPGNEELIMHVPSRAKAGLHTISVNIAGLSVTATQQFNVVVPVITSVSPDEGQQYGEVTIKGENFIDFNGGNTGVVFSDFKTGLNSRGAFVKSRSATEIVVFIPSLWEGDYKITVMVLGGFANTTEPFHFDDGEE